VVVKRAGRGGDDGAGPLSGGSGRPCVARRGGGGHRAVSGPRRSRRILLPDGLTVAEAAAGRSTLDRENRVLWRWLRVCCFSLLFPLLLPSLFLLFFALILLFFSSPAWSRMLWRPARARCPRAVGRLSPPVPRGSRSCLAAGFAVRDPGGRGPGCWSSTSGLGCTANRRGGADRVRGAVSRSASAPAAELRSRHRRGSWSIMSRHHSDMVAYRRPVGVRPGIYTFGQRRTREAVVTEIAAGRGDVLVPRCRQTFGFLTDPAPVRAVDGPARPTSSRSLGRVPCPDGRRFSAAGRLSRLFSRS